MVCIVCWLEERGSGACYRVCRLRTRSMTHMHANLVVRCGGDHGGQYMRRDMVGYSLMEGRCGVYGGTGTRRVPAWGARDGGGTVENKILMQRGLACACLGRLQPISVTKSEGKSPQKATNGARGCVMSASWADPVALPPHRMRARLAAMRAAPVGCSTRGDPAQATCGGTSAGRCAVCWRRPPSDCSAAQCCPGVSKLRLEAHGRVVIDGPIGYCFS